MKLLLIFITATLLLISCSEGDVYSPYEHLETKLEGENEMLLYSCGEVPNVDTLVDFCSNMKINFTTGVFHYIVFFDDKSTASFPNNPITGLYNDEELSKHIKGIYTFNRLNGYSVLDYYELNSWDSEAIECKI